MAQTLPSDGTGEGEGDTAEEGGTWRPDGSGPEEAEGGVEARFERYSSNQRIVTDGITVGRTDGRTKPSVKFFSPFLFI